MTLRTLRLPKNYRERRANHKPSAPTSHQTKVYDIGVGLAFRHNVRVIVDLGCGTGRKAANGGRIPVEGWDLNRDTRQGGEYKLRFADLECCKDLPVYSDALIICADVIEHLNSPINLLHWFRKQVEAGSILVVSTPDRAKVRTTPNLGPPRNPNHVREWTLIEFWGLLTDARIPVVSAGHVLNHEEEKGQVNTCIFICQKRR